MVGDSRSGAGEWESSLRIDMGKTYVVGVGMTKVAILNTENAAVVPAV